MIHRKFLILGHPRSGTGYLAKLFQANGYNIGHETIGDDGTSNWQMAVCAQSYPFAGDKYRRQDVLFQHIYHVIRHPLHAINSIAHVEHGSEAFRSKYVPLMGNAFERAILSYFGWNQIIHAQNPAKTFTLENARMVLNLEQDVAVYNQRPHEWYSEAEIKTKVSAAVWEYYLFIAHQYNTLHYQEINGI